MAFNPSPEVADAREVARKWNCQQVIIIGCDWKRGIFKTASFGETRELCEAAKKANIAITDMIQNGQIEVLP